jgi:hypothetical protein
MIHAGDFVEEAATKRQGKVMGVRGTQDVASDWTVQFSDGKPPIIKLFQSEAELLLVTCPHKITEPGLCAASSIVEW